MLLGGGEALQGVCARGLDNPASFDNKKLIDNSIEIGRR
jgi:hypothetical protein